MVSTIHGYPRHGRDRQLKKAIEGYWKGRIDQSALLDQVRDIRQTRLRTMVEAGLDEIPVGDFSLYDHVLDTATLVGAVPERHAGLSGLDRYFAMARGTDSIEPLEMTKWFNSNYHYLVPELTAATGFALDPGSLLEQVDEAIAQGVTPRVILVGPVSFLSLSTSVDQDATFQPIQLLERLLAVYAELLTALAERGVAWVQLDEPIAATDLDAQTAAGLTRSLEVLGALTDRPKLVVASYYGALGENLDLLANAPVEGLAVDLSAAGRADVEALRAHPGLAGKRLIAGVVDGRSVWRTDLDAALDLARTVGAGAASVDVSSSCTLLHLPHDLTRETELDPRLVAQLSFADETLAEIVTLARGLAEGDEAIAAELAADRQRRETRRTETWLRDDAVRARAAAVTEDDARRATPYQERAAAQQAHLGLPVAPTTTIGSFPQTGEIRKARAAWQAGRIDDESYVSQMHDEIDRVIQLQERIGLDVLVHGEPERNDMVAYFADQLTGIFATRHGWVQSYGTRCVRPPLIAGDVARKHPMTVEWTTWAQSRTERPVKGMLTGPVTILAWSFVRDDQPLGETARQVALALRDEVVDLEAAGTAVIQVDEPALRELLPLRRADWQAYLDWAVEAFRLSTSGVQDRTQIHTHMCYAEFGDVIGAIDALDADVISLEAARSAMAVVDELAADGYSRQVGPGVWDIHSPRVPDVEEMTTLGRTAIERLGRDRVWINPDCGLKTRGYDEVEPALENLVAAARALRS
ncbi:MAG TPA: 5-methyltetrahydropteroyltriglutamate--homocysteine S-methyltransferase [Candidatus Avipropionibacterium avicola]|uniref:5-methyltetrahydropteroyltriglutamate--homocysteine methyltransferase n=1 Tax=Candidatus Avipropionibacterium avicola TaxID=2840701 RepID=A0A9D1GX65_9ACTN|nr:5-methyltetrahydropteroyltriglutamate--homocysteine S-methyltransferase [Candidatus Avipropionibacterium avicola]